jgi:acylphosphatase
MAIRAIRLRITGRVQGVGYRAGFASHARRLKLSGWVRNRLDGSVEALVEGTPQALEEITAWAKHGPELARVDQVQTNDESTTVTPSIFEILPTE